MQIEQIRLKKFALYLSVCMSAYTGAMDAPVEKEADRLYQDAESGNREAQYLLGERIYRERGLNYVAQAENWFKKAAAKNHAGALHKLGEIAQKRGDNELAIERYSKAAEEGNIFSHFELACLLGKRGLKFLNKEIYHLKAVLMCSIPANSSETNLAVVVAKTKASAAYRLGEIFCSETEQTEVAQQLAVEYYRTALEHDSACDKARCKLAELLLRKNASRQSMKTLLNGANESCVQAQCLLGDIARDEGQYQEAIFYYKRAFDSAYAWYEIGILIELGKGTEKDEKRAYVFFCQAAKQGHPQAIEKLRLLEGSNAGVQCVLARLNRLAIGMMKNDAKAIGLYEKSCRGKCVEAIKELEAMAKNSPEAAFAMGNLYRDKIIEVLPSCPYKMSHDDYAANWYDSAARMEHEKALEELKIMGESGNRRAIENLILYFSQSRLNSEREQARYWSRKFTESFVVRPKVSNDGKDH